MIAKVAAYLAKSVVMWSAHKIGSKIWGKRRERRQP